MKNQSEIVEIRRYTISTGRWDEFLVRFQDVTIPIMNRLGFRFGQAWSAIDGPEVFTYTLYWAKEQDMFDGWELFGSQEDWLASKAAEGDTPLLSSFERSMGKSESWFIIG